MYFSCLLCKQTSVEKFAPFLCGKCGNMLERAQDHLELQSLYRYSSALRHLILKVKIEGSYRSFTCLRHLFLNSERTAEILRHCESIMPAPSSLWSRLRGRIDLAWLLASSLSLAYEKELERAPSKLHWQFRKRSQISNRERVEMQETFYSAENKKTVLIVDDVVTSGYTLRRTSSALSHGNYRFLTLASALR